MYSVYMSHVKDHRIIATYPFLRFNIDKDSEKHLYIPELALIFSGVLSYVLWPDKPSSFDSWLVFLIWIFICGSFISLALANMRHMLLPNKTIAPIFVTVVVYILTGAMIASRGESSSIGQTIASPLLGGLLFGGVAYLLYVVSSGRWIGGGDVKLAAIVGLLLGWKLALIALAAYVVVTGFMLLTIGVAQYQDTKKIKLLPSGVIWAVVTILTYILGNYFIAV